MIDVPNKELTQLLWQNGSNKESPNDHLITLFSKYSKSGGAQVHVLTEINIILSTQRYKLSDLRFSAISVSHLSPFSSSFSLS